MKTLAYYRSLGALALCLLFNGCSLVPQDQTPAAPIPETWRDSHADGVQSPSGTPIREIDWEAFVTDTQLRTLIRQALSNNRDFRQTVLNVQAVRAQYGIEKAARLPSIELEAGATRQRLPASLNPSDSSTVESTYRVGVGITQFELDLFGRVRSLSDAILQEYLATENAAQRARISLIGEVIQAYLLRDAAYARYQLALKTLQSRQESLELISRRRQAGTATALDYHEANGLVEEARAESERITREYRQAGNALALLVGTSQLDIPTEQSDAPYVVLQDINVGIDSDILLNRPDIRAAEHQLKARNASIGAARAAFFPRISLTGFNGTASGELSDLFGSGQHSWSFTPQITLPIFAGGRNRANLELAKVRRGIAVANYEQSIQTAFTEVSDVLVAAETLRREESARQNLASSSREALRLAEARYKAGVDDHLRYLEAQRSAFNNEMALIDISAQRQIALVSLFKALGGSWKVQT